MIRLRVESSKTDTYDSYDSPASSDGGASRNSDSSPPTTPVDDGAVSNGGGATGVGSGSRSGSAMTFPYPHWWLNTAFSVNRAWPGSPALSG